MSTEVQGEQVPGEPDSAPGPPAATGSARRGVPVVGQPRRRPVLVRWCAAAVESTVFNLAIVAVILANAVLLGLGTFPQFDQVGGLLDVVEALFLSIFVMELLIRLVSYGTRPQDFFRDGWNVFDLVVVSAAFVPGLQGHSTLLRMVRILRVIRVVRFFPALRTIVAAVWRSLPGVGGFLVMALVTLYVYGMAGWLLFADAYPDEFGTVGLAVLTLFVLLSLENLPDMTEAALAVSPWSLLYFISFVLVASYLLVNVLVGVIISSMEETRQLELTKRLDPDYDVDGDGVPDELDRIALAQRLDNLRTAVADLERELRIDRGQRPG